MSTASRHRSNTCPPILREGNSINVMVSFVCLKKSPFPQYILHEVKQTFSFVQTKPLGVGRRAEPHGAGGKDWGRDKPHSLSLLYSAALLNILHFKFANKQEGVTEMAAHEESERKTYLRVKYFSICEVYDRPQPHTKPEEVTNPQTNEIKIKHIHRYKGVDGYIDRIEWYSREFEGTRFQGHYVHLNDPDSNWQAVLEIPFDSGAWDCFAKSVENLDFSQKVYFTAWKGKNKDGKDKLAFCMRQPDMAGEIVKWLYTIENPGECPPPTHNQRTNKWNFDAQQDWLIERIETVVIPMVERAREEREQNGPPPTASRTTEVNAAQNNSPQQLAKAAQAPGRTQRSASPPDDPFGDSLSDGVPF